MENSRFDNWNQQLSQFNGFARQVGNAANTAIDSIAEFGAFIPLLEILVTIAAFYAAGLGEIFGIEVLVGLVFAQIGALYLTAHYKGVAMSTAGQLAIYLSIVVGAANTGLAVYLALNAHGGGEMMALAWQFPAMSAALAVLFMYVAKMFTHEQVANRRRLQVESENEIAEITRARQSERSMNRARDEMQQTRLNMEKMALRELSRDERMQAIQKRAMYLTVVQDIMNQYDVKASSRLGKQLLGLADEAVAGGEPAAAAPLAAPPAGMTMDEFTAVLDELRGADGGYPPAPLVADFLRKNGRQPMANGHGANGAR